MKKILTIIIIIVFAVNSAGQGYALRPPAHRSAAVGSTLVDLLSGKTSSAGNIAEAVAMLDKTIEDAIAKGRIIDPEADEEEKMNFLYEHEVYKVLEAIGILVPEHHIIDSPDDPLPDLPEGEEVVVKVVTTNQHKSDKGSEDDIEGVLIVPSDLVEETVRGMFKRKDAVAVMIAKKVKMAPLLGEISLGFADTVTGRLFCFAEGGTLTDYRKDKAYCDYRFPFSAEELIKKTGLGRNFIYNEFRGRRMPFTPEYLEDLISKLVEFKKVYDRDGKFEIPVLDINPFAAVLDGTLWACDAKLEYTTKTPAPKVRPIERLRGLLHPKSIAVIGASTSHPDGLIVPLMDNLIDDLESGSLEELHLINRNPGDYRNHEFTQQTPEDADIYIVVCGAERAVEPAVDLLKKGKRVVVIAADENMELDERLKEALAEAPDSALLLGPNTLLGSMGNVYPTFVNRETGGMVTEEDSDVALICQSGRVQGSTASNLGLRGLRAAYNFGVGNALDLRPVDFLEYMLEHEPDIRVIGIFLEGLRDYHESGRLQEQIIRAKEKGVTVIIRKGAVSEEGAEAAASHTASTAGEYKHFKSVFEQAGAIVFDNDDTWVEAIYTASWFHKHGLPVSNRFFTVNTGGADCGELLDSLAKHKSTLVKAEPDETIAGILKQAGLRTHAGDPLDVTAAARIEQYNELFNHLFTREDIGFIIAGYIQWTHSTHQSTTFLEQLKHLPRSKPIIFANADYSDHAMMIKRELRKAGYLVFENMPSCIQALSAVLGNAFSPNKASSSGLIEKANEWLSEREMLGFTHSLSGKDSIRIKLRHAKPGEASSYGYTTNIRPLLPVQRGRLLELPLNIAEEKTSHPELLTEEIDRLVREWLGPKERREHSKAVTFRYYEDWDGEREISAKNREGLLAALKTSSSGGKTKRLPRRYLAIAGIDIEHDKDLSEYSTLGLKSYADNFVEPASMAELKKILEKIRTRRKAKIHVSVIGAGSNTFLFERVNGLVISLKKFNWFTVQTDTVVRVGAGISLSKLTEAAAKEGLSGLEFASVVPGTAAGAVLTNATYGVPGFRDAVNAKGIDGVNYSIEDIVESVVIITRAGKLVTLTKDQL